MTAAPGSHLMQYTAHEQTAAAVVDAPVPAAAAAASGSALINAPKPDASPKAAAVAAAHAEHMPAAAQQQSYHVRWIPPAAVGTSRTHTMRLGLNQHRREHLLLLRLLARPVVPGG